ncbi:hypothetical protein [Citricoccus nitrophenolicus]|uniref:hypothetical protein n=1 Tax=Citricoccus nitrophenolicus TaxID=863575 RepID=UPI0031E73ADA
MCYEFPGPRCSPDERKKMDNAKKAYQEADALVRVKEKAFKEATSEAAKESLRQELQQAQADRQTARVNAAFAEQEYTEAKAKRDKAKNAYFAAKEDYLRTPDGIKELREKGQHAKADRYEKERQQDIANFHVHEAVKNNPSDPKALDAAKLEISFDRTMKTTHRRENLAANTTLPEIQQEFMKSRSPKLRSALAHNRNLIPEAQNRLAMDKDPEIRLGVARSTTDRKLLNKLSQDEDVRVHVAVASNKNTDPATLRRMSTMATHGEQRSLNSLRAGDGPGTVRMAVAQNPSTPSATLTRMYNQGPERDFTGEVTDRESNLANSILENPSVSPKLLNKAAKEELGKGAGSDYKVEYAVIKSPHLDRKTAVALIKNKAKHSGASNARSLAYWCAHEDIKKKVLKQLDDQIAKEKANA